MRRLLLAIGMVVSLMIAGAHRTAAQEASPETGTVGPLVADIKVGDRTLHAACAGSGGPSVIFETGGPDEEGMVPFVTEAGEDISAATGARFCGYDRANSGKSASDPTGVRTLEDAAADLLAVMSSPEMACPCVVVGQSLGGAIALFALHVDRSLFAGLILLDAPPVGYYPQYVASLPPDSAEAQPDALAYWEGANEENLNLADGFSRMPEFTEPFDFPTVVVTHGLGAPPPCFPCSDVVPTEKLEEIWQAGQIDLAEATGGRLVVSEKTDHFIAETDAELVLTLMADVIEAAKHPSTGGTPVS